ncbi:FG-GAP repeat protein [Streptomyces sp. MNP-20]|uniref:FG-GAP repeat protein n=1 Tax=Streptomyces sp. MNP-20 TaxID=2721165 RepID=UPI001554FBC2|nr:FG-GAP repeat protein [Streptomyces sp. MNP-20]
MRKNRSAALTAASFLLLTGAGVAAAPAALAGTPGSTHANDRNSDYNGDGYEDLLVGAPGATVDGHKGAGLVTVQYGSRQGIGTTRVARLSEASTGGDGTPEAGDGFGTTVASGDLNSDGYDDAVIAAPGEDVDGQRDAGRVTIFWGTKKGLKPGLSDWIEAEEPRAGERFGTGVAAARFSGATEGDVLAVTDRDELDTYTYGDQPHIPAGRAFWRQSSQRLAGPVAGSEGARAAARRVVLPTSLTTGDYDDNGFADLVVSGVTTGAEPGHGWSTYYSGHAAGLTKERELRGGPAAATGDIDGDGYDDLVTGEPDSPDDGGETLTGGLVGVRYGSPNGPSSAVKWWSQGTAGVPGVVEKGDRWGADLSVDDTDHDGYADVAIGAPGEDVGRVVDAGAVWVLRGARGGLTTRGAASWTQNSAGVPGVAEQGDKWGAQVRLADPNRDRRFDLIASAPGENAGDGVAWFLPAARGGVTASGSWTFGVKSLGVPVDGAAFGTAVDE